MMSTSSIVAIIAGAAAISGFLTYKKTRMIYETDTTIDYTEGIIVKFGDLVPYDNTRVKTRVMKAGQVTTTRSVNILGIKYSHEKTV